MCFVSLSEVEPLGAVGTNTDVSLPFENASTIADWLATSSNYKSIATLDSAAEMAKAGNLVIGAWKNTVPSKVVIY